MLKSTPNILAVSSLNRPACISAYPERLFPSCLLKGKATGLSSQITNQQMPSPFSTFEIHFDDNRTIFIPGQKIEGYIVLTVTETVRLSILKIKFNGLISTYLAKNNEG